MHKLVIGLNFVEMCVNLFVSCIRTKMENNEMGWACGAYGMRRWVCRVLVGKPEGRRSLGRPRRRWVDNIRMDLWGEGGV